MSYNLPPGCSQGDIDRALGGCSPDWICEDPECRQGWVGDCEHFPCGVDHCEVICCDECRTVCAFCDSVICSKHRVKYQDIDGEVWACAECKAIGEARDREELRGRTA